MKLSFKIKNSFIPLIILFFSFGCGGSSVNQEHDDHEMTDEEHGEMMEGDHDEMMENEMPLDSAHHENEEEIM